MRGRKVRGFVNIRRVASRAAGLVNKVIAILSIEFMVIYRSTDLA